MRNFLLIIIAMVMLLPTAAFGASNGWGPDIGAPDMWSAENREYWSAKIEVVPFVRHNSLAHGTMFVANECASAIKAENIYYAIKLTVSENVYDAWWDAAEFKVSHTDISGTDNITSTLLKEFPLGSSGGKMSFDNIKGGGVYWLTHGGSRQQGMAATGNYFEKADGDYKFGAKNIYYGVADTAKPTICASIASSWEITENTWNSMYPLTIKGYKLNFNKSDDGYKTITIVKDANTVVLRLDGDNKLANVDVAINGGTPQNYTAMPSSPNPCSEDILLAEVFATFNLSFGRELTEEAITNNFGFNIEDKHCFSYTANELTPTPVLNPAYCSETDPYMTLENGDALEKADFKLYVFNESGGFYEQTDDYKVSLEKYVTKDGAANYRLKIEGNLDSIGYFAVTAKNTNTLESAFAKFTVNGEGNSDTDGAVTEQGTIGGSFENDTSSDKPEDVIAFGPVNNTDPGTIPTIKIEEIPEDEYTNKGKEGDNRHKPYDEMQNHANKNEQFIGAYQIDINGGLVKEGKNMRIRFKFDEEFSGKWVLILHYCNEHNRVEEWKIKIDDEGYVVIEDVDSFSPFAVYSTTEPVNQETESSSPSYSVPTYQVELQTSLGGSISRISLVRGSSRTFTFEKKNGVYPTVYVNGVNMGRMPEYTVSNIQESLTIYLDYSTAVTLPKTGSPSVLTMLISAVALGGSCVLMRKR